MSEGRNVVSISDNTDIREGWRVRAFYLPASMNELGRTLAERKGIRTETAARALAAKWAADYSAETQG